MWAAADNGKDVSWKGAIKYCRDLRVAGYVDWRLPAIDELQGIYDDSAYASLPPKENTEYIAGKVKGNLSLTGTYQWSANRVEDDRGHPTGYGWQFDFWHGSRHKEQLGYSGHTTALCVRVQ
jgi:hypothetical protein